MVSLNIFPAALWHAEIHFRCVLCGYRRVRRGSHSDHRVGTYRGDVDHLHQHYLELLRTANQRVLEIFIATMDTRHGRSRLRMENATRYSPDFLYAN